jgi:benzylsuccinate CoA-transferase BbsF subunit
MGFGFEVLRSAKADIILVDLPGCGSIGPWAERGTLGGVLMAASGLNDISGFEGRPPYGIATAFPDFTSPYLLASSVLAAIHERDRTGRGQQVEVNQLAATIGLMGAEWMRFSAEGSLPRNANRNANYCPHGVYLAAGTDAWVAIAVGDDAQWRALVEVIGRPGLANDTRFATHAQRKANEEALDRIVAAWTSTQDKWEIARLLQSRGVAAAPVETLAEMVDKDPQLRHRNHYQRLRQPSEPDFELTVDGEAVHLEGVNPVVTRAPMMGEHNEHMLRDLAGLSEAEFDALVLAGVIN